jgi:hypothetical protein
LDAIQTDFGQRLNFLRKSNILTMDNMNSNIAKLMSVVNKLVDNRAKDSEHQQHAQKDAVSPALVTAHQGKTSTRFHSGDASANTNSRSEMSDDSEMSAESSGLTEYPEHKRMHAIRSKVQA